MKSCALLVLSLFWLNLGIVYAQVHKVSGEVTSVEKGAPVAGVSVVVKGTTVGTVTNQEGFYQLYLPENAKSLVFSYIGMKTVEVTVSGSTLNVALKPDVVGVDEVVIVAYGSMPKERFTGSVSTVRSNELEQFQTAGFSKALQGLSAGVLTTNGNGQPGEEAEIRIRGFNTFGDAGPLVVLDGFPYDGNLSSIPLSEIESLTILKDASATALYGSRAANGVIIVTTKAGLPGTSELRLQLRYGISDRAIPEYERVSVPEYYELQWEGIRNALIQTGTGMEEANAKASEELVSTLGGYNAYDVPDGEVVQSNGKINPDAGLLWRDKWTDELFVQGIHREVILSTRGGTEKTTYFLSGTILDDGGIIKASNLKRYAVRANVNTQFNPWIKAGVNFSGALSEQNYPLSSGTDYLNPFYFTGLVAPIYPVYLYDNDGNLQTDAQGNRLFDYGTDYDRSRGLTPGVNPLGTIKLDKQLYKKDVFTLRSFIDFKLTSELSFKSSISADYFNFNGLSHKNMKYGDGQNFSGHTSRQTDRTVSYTANQMFRFQKDFGGHIFRALAGHENYNYKFNVLSAKRSGFPFPGLVELDAAAVGEGSGSFEDNYRLESYLAKIDYAFGEKYFANFSIRTDGNSRFAKEVRWGSFWSTGVAWMLSREAFMKDYSWLNTLEVKMSYGKQGNDKIGSFYGYQGLYETGVNNIEYPGLLASRLATPGLTWESLSSANFGVGVKLFNRLSVNFEYYSRRNEDLLFEQPLPPSTGFTSIDANIARLSNNGFDFEMGALLLKTKDVSWNLDINLGHFRNKIKELPQEFIVNGNKRWEVGRSIYDFWIEEYAGVNPDNGKSQWYYNVIQTDTDGNEMYDSNGDPVLTGEKGVTDSYSLADRYYVGSSIPDLFGGVSNSISFYGFDLSVLLSFGIGGKVMDQPYQWLLHSGLFGTDFHRDVLNRWTPENTNTDVPAVNGDQYTNRRSTRFLTDASYLSVRNVSFGYQVPSRLVSKINLAFVGLRLTADNLALVSARRGLDPRQSFSGYIGRLYVPIRTISVGLDVQF